MIHKIHDGAHLPSVLGVGTNADGTRSYAATPVPYRGRRRHATRGLLRRAVPGVAEPVVPHAAQPRLLGADRRAAGHR